VTVEPDLRIKVGIKNGILKVVAGALEYTSPAVSYGGDLQGVEEWYKQRIGDTNSPGHDRDPRATSEALVQGASLSRRSKRRRPCSSLRWF